MPRCSQDAMMESCDSSTEGVPAVVGGRATKVTETVPSVHKDWKDVVSDDDNSGHILDKDYTGMFEGPEKTLEVVFRRVSDEHTDYSMGELSGTHSAGPVQKVGLRRLSRSDLDRICARARCKFSQTKT